MGKHKVPHGEEGQYTAQTRKNATHDGKHRQGTAEGTQTQREVDRRKNTTQSDIPHRDGRTIT